MNVGKQILELRKARSMTQEEFGKLFHVTRQTVSNWENEKSYPDLQTLVSMSDMFEISLDKLFREDKKMIKTMDRERLYSEQVKKRTSVIDFFTGTGTGLVISCLLAPASMRRAIVIGIGIAMILTGWYLKTRNDKAIQLYLKEQEED